jgi:hypothetical protein
VRPWSRETGSSAMALIATAATMAGHPKWRRRAPRAGGWAAMEGRELVRAMEKSSATWELGAPAHIQE